MFSQEKGGGNTPPFLCVIIFFMDNVPSILAPRETNQIYEVNGEQYEVLPEVVNEVAAGLLLTWEKLDRPGSVFTKNGEKLMEVFIASWQDLFPRESRRWIEERKMYQLAEKSIREQIKQHSGRSLASIPLYIYKLMKLFFKEDKNFDKEFYLKLIKKFPIFRMANKA